MRHTNAPEGYLGLSNFYILRFGYCNNSADGDFIDNIDGRFNLYVATGHDNGGNEYIITLHKDEFCVFQNETLHDRIGAISNKLTDLFPPDVAKALIQSGYDKDPDGVIDFAPDYEKYYFEAREDAEVKDFSPCYFVISSVTYDCAAKINVSDGSVTFSEGCVDKLSDFYGHVDEDDWYVLGVSAPNSL
jgi:hypothetical protein